MSERGAFRVIRAPGTIYIGSQPPFDPNNLSGTPLGNTQAVYLAFFGTGFTVWAEEYGEPADQLETLRDTAMGCFFRAWDDDVIQSVMPNEIVGSISQHRVITLHGDREPGMSVYEDRRTTMLFAPHNPKDNPAVYAYAAVPLVEESQQLQFAYGNDLGLPVVWRFFRDDAGKIGEVGRIWDLGGA